MFKIKMERTVKTLSGLYLQIKMDRKSAHVHAWDPFNYERGFVEN